MKRKLIVLIVMLVMVFSTLNISKLSFETVSATGYEKPIDYTWMNYTLHVLSEIVKNNLTYGLHQGRLFCTEGDRSASNYIYTWMAQNINNLTAKVYKQCIGQNNYNGDNKTIEKIYQKSNDNIDILSLSLNFTNGTGPGCKTATISDNESFPIPKLILGTRDVNSSGSQRVVLFTNDDFTRFIKETTPCSYIIMDYVNKNGVSDFCGQLVYIQDYSLTTENETVDKIHLIKFDPNESEDTYMEKIQKVIDSGGAGFICISTNPSLLKNLAIPIFGISISPKEGIEILNHLENNQNLSISFNENSAQQGTFSLYASSQCLGEKKIGLIEEHGDQPLFYWPMNIPWYMPTAMTRLCSFFELSNYVGFILYNKTLSDAHYMFPNTGIVYQNPWISPSFSPYILRPFLFVNGSISFDTGGSINIWDWANDSNLKASFSIGEHRNDSAKSYNVICEVKGKDTNHSIMISGGHHDWFWGEGTADNGVGTSVMLGILKWLNDNSITPECNLTFVSFSGEEGVDRGSGFYAYNESLFDKNKNMTYLFNLDFLAHNTSLSKLWIPVTDNKLTEDIKHTVSRTNYLEVINNKYLFEVNNTNVSNDALPFFKRFGGPNTNLKLLEMNKEKINLKNDHSEVFYARHRTGKNHTRGDSLTGIDWTDFRISADIALNITKFLILESPKDEFINCTFNKFDICGDGLNDSVKISFTATTNRTSWATVNATLYNRTTGEIASDTNSTGFTIYQGVNRTSFINVTLFPNHPPGVYNASVKIYDEKMNLDDECHQLVNLSPYGKPIADFEYKLEGIINHTVNFTDMSMASPGADIDEWYWDFDDGAHSHEQSPAHTYLISADFTVTLTVWDTNGFNDSWSDIIAVPNCVPFTSFTMDASAVCVGTALSFTSTSYDEDGSIENYTWDFGDGCYSYEENPIHSYSQSGVYTVTLMTTDDDGLTNTSMITDDLVIADALVDDDFRDDPDAHEWDTITEGLDDVENGGVIYVFKGIYASFEIDKSVALYGESREDVRINSGNPGVKIRYYNVTVDGFNVSSGIIRMDVNVKSDENHSSNVTINNCNVYGSSTIGILLNQSSFCVIENCTIQGNTYGVKIMNDSQYNVIRKCVISQGDYGVYVSDSSYNFIGSPSITNPYPTDCLFTNTMYGVKLEDSDHNFILGCDFDGTPASSAYYSETTKGIYLDNSANNTISTCSIHDMTDKGMYLVDSTWNKIEHCKISWNPIGITFDNSPENLITQNHFGGNSEFAVYMPTDTQFNHVYYNDFFVNGNGTTKQTWDANGAKGAENLWDKDGNKTLTKTGDGEGNYWSDYTGMDDDEDGIGDTPYEINSSGILRNDSYPVMSPYEWCNFTRDSTLPLITNVSATPHTVGFGYNVTIQAVVTDNGSNISIVKVEVTYPDESIENYTMESSGDSLYEYVLTDTWLTGQYNFSVWAMDYSYNSNSSSGHHFHVSADASISIATLKNSYSGTEYINITDPPNPPENYTLVDRGLTWDEYYNTNTGQNILEVSAGPINYQNDTNIWTPINNTLTQLAENHPAYVYGYRTGNNRGLFGAYFKSNAQNDWPVAFTYNRSDDPTVHVVRSKLVGVGYVDPQTNWAYQYLQNVQNSQGQTNDYSVTYPGVFTGTDVTWSYGNTGLKEEITLSNTTKTVLQSHPPSQYGLNNASSYLVFITKLDYQNLNLYNDSGLLEGNVTISDVGVDFKDVLGQFKCALPLGDAYELNNDSSRHKLTYRIVHLNGNTYLLSGLKVSDLNAMTFPVVIDPTLTVYSTSSDGYIYKSGSTYSTVQGASTGTVNGSGTYITIGQKKIVGPTYYVYRGFVFFNTSALPSNAYLDNATLSLYKKDDYSTTDFDITIQNGQPTYPHNPMQTGDYFRNYYSGNGGTLGTARFTSGYNAITMSNLNWINKTGITKLCLRSSSDIRGTAPTGNEYVNVHSSEFLGMCPPRLVINYRNQSKIKNTGSTDIKGYLLIQVQYYNSSQGSWLLENDTVNETTPRTITSGSQLALDTIFNGLVRASDLTHGTGVTYRVYTAFRDPEGNILRTNDDMDLEAWWQFNKT